MEPVKTNPSAAGLHEGGNAVAVRHYLHGAQLAESREYTAAVTEMSMAVALDPTLHTARLQLGLLYLTMAQPEQAAAVLGPLESSEDQALVQFKRGLEALMHDDFDSCIRQLSCGIGLNERNKALNRDMSLIIERVRSIMESADPSSGAVRTDFSLYGLTQK